MTRVKVPLFGEIDYQSGKANKTFDDIDVFKATLDFENRKIRVGLWINYDQDVDNQKFKEMEQFISEIEEIHDCCIETMRLDLDSEKPEYVKEFVEYHIRECGLKPSLTLDDLKLVRINFYPQEEEGDFAVFDYSYGTDISDQLLVMKFDILGRINYLTWES